MAKSRQDHIEFDRNYCEHYKPVRGEGDYCALKLNATARMKEAQEKGEPNMSPCIGGHKASNVLTLCPKWVRRSLEHAQARADSIAQMMSRLTVVMPVINKWRNKQRPYGKQEIIVCPQCNGRLHLIQSSYNGHVQAKCESKGCINFIE